MATVLKKVQVVCPDCKQIFELNHLSFRDVIIVCPHCETELEIINVDPLELDFYYEQDWKAREDWNGW